MRKKPAFYTAAIAIGDIICSTPTVRKLAEVYGEPVRVFTFFPELFEGLPYVSGVEDIREWKKDPAKERWLRETYDLHQTFWKMGKKIQTSDGRGVEMRHSQMDIRQYHAIDLGFNLLPEELHCDFVPTSNPSFELPLKYVCIHASKTWNSRSWSIENWKELCAKLSENGIAVVLVGKDGMTAEEIEKYKSTFNGNVEDRLIAELSEKRANELQDTVGLIDLTNKTDFSQLWHILNNAQMVITMDSGILHIAGTTKTHILQLGSSIHPKFRAPYRNGSQDYRYKYLSGSCGIHCASDMKYSLRDWETNYNGATPIQSLPLIDTCLEKKPQFDCHPSPASVLEECLKLWQIDYPEDVWENSIKDLHVRSNVKRVIPSPVHPEYVPREREEFNVKFRVDWHDSGKLHVIGDERDPRHFTVSFYDLEEKELVHRDDIRTGFWIAPSWRETRWKVVVESEGKALFESISSKEDPILIEIGSASLGDTIGALAVVERYRKSNDRKVEVICNHRNAFKYSYPELRFHNFQTDPTKMKGKSYSEYHKLFYKFDRPLMQGYADQLGVDIDGIVTKIDKQKNSKRPIKEKYVCFSMHSTAQAKHWNNEEGWQKLCELLRSNGLVPVCVDQHESFGADGYTNPVPRNARRSLGMDLKETIRYIQHAEFFIGLSSGLSWVANAIGVPTVLISNVTSHDHEFNGDNVVRITDESVCHGCFHTETFDANDWAWCPLHKDTEKHFICSKVITADKVLMEIKKKGLA